MRRTLGGVAAALLALTAVPALAADGPALLAPCAGVAAADRLTTAGLETGVDTPQLPGDETERTVVLDLAGQPAGTTATVDAAITWGIAANDYDLDTTGGGTSANFNITDTVPTEQAAGSGIGHCDSFTVAVTNFAAPVVVDTIDATLGVTLEEPVEEGVAARTEERKSGRSGKPERPARSSSRAAGGAGSRSARSPGGSRPGRRPDPGRRQADLLHGLVPVGVEVVAPGVQGLGVVLAQVLLVPHLEPGALELA